MRRLALVLCLGLAGCAPSLDPVGPPVVRPALTADKIRMPDDAKLAERVFLPNGPPRAVVIGVHGFNDYSNAFTGPGEFFARHGIATYAYDQRGFGMSPNHGGWVGEDALVADLNTVARLVRQQHPGVPTYLIGDSMGGAVAIAALTRPDPPPVDGAILVAPAVWGRALMGPVQRGALWLFGHMMPWLPITASGLKIIPSDNMEMLIALARDPLVIKTTQINAIYGLVDLMDAAKARVGALTAPALVLYGWRDEIVPHRAACAMFDELPPRPPGQWRLALYRRGYHMLLRDLQAETVLRDILAWIDDRAAPLPSGAEALPKDDPRPRARQVDELLICSFFPDRRKEPLLPAPVP